MVLYTTLYDDYDWTIFAMESEIVSTEDEMWELRDRLLERFRNYKDLLKLEDGEPCGLYNCSCQYIEDWAWRCYNPKCYRFFENNGIKITPMLYISDDGYIMRNEDTCTQILDKNGYAVVIPEIQWKNDGVNLPEYVVIRAHDIFPERGERHCFFRRQGIIMEEPGVITETYGTEIRDIVDKIADQYGNTIISYGEPEEAYAFWEQSVDDRSAYNSPKSRLNAFCRWVRKNIVYMEETENEKTI